MDSVHKLDTDKLLQMDDEPYVILVCSLFIICHDDNEMDSLKARKILRYLLSKKIINRNNYDVRELFGLSYAAEIGAGSFGIRLTYDNAENFKGIGINWGTKGFVYTDSRNKGLIISYDEFSKLFTDIKSKVILGYGYFDYEVDRDNYLNILVPDFRFATGIKMKTKKDYLISVNANDKYPPENEE